jgi:membrane-bound ClpP family serine protease
VSALFFDIAVPLSNGGDGDMLGLIAAVLIILWLLGFLAFHVSAGLVHLLLIVGIVLLVLHFLRGSSRTA